MRAIVLALLASCAPPRAPRVDSTEYVIGVVGARVSVSVQLPPGSTLEGSDAVRELRADGRAAALGERCDECRITYRVDLLEPVTTLDEVLVRAQASDVRLYLRGTAFNTGLARDGDRFVGTTHDLGAPFVIAPTRSLYVGATTLEVAFVPGKRASSDDEISSWLEQSLRAVTRYYARAPFARAVVTVHDQDDDEIFGLADHHGEGSIALHFGPESRVDGDDDWVATHELLHLAFPFVGRRHAWLSEGMATYVEPVARVRAGQLEAETLWRDFRRMLPKGQPVAGDEGLERTRTWGRIYWGGALFFLLADIEIRLRSKKGLEDAMRALPPAPAAIDDVLRAADGATGTTVFRDLYAKYAARAERVDLDALFARLGVTDTGLDDGAELAHIRRAIATRDE